MSETFEPALDLDACAREPIHIPGAIQPHGSGRRWKGAH